MKVRLLREDRTDAIEELPEVAVRHVCEHFGYPWRFNGETPYLTTSNLVVRAKELGETELYEKLVALRVKWAMLA